MKGAANVAEQIAMCQLYIHDAIADRIHKYAKEAVNNFAEGDERRLCDADGCETLQQEHEPEHGRAAEGDREEDDRGGEVLLLIRRRVFHPITMIDALWRAIKK
jgi:hypothetical protein